MPENASLRFPDAPLVATSDVEVQRLRAAVAAKLTGGAVVPVRVGRFVILERIGQGAMGVVYSAYDAELDRKVAIKILQPTGDDRALRQRLVREAQAMARLSHPNVVGVFEIGEHDGHGFVAMEFVRGRTLRQWLADARRSPREILGAYLQAGRGLAAAHAAGVVHRDFKPDNVLVDAELDGQGAPRVRVLDFGLAQTRVTPEAAASLPDGAIDADLLVTRAGVRVGTPGYMAPEQILGEPTDARSDQFAFCIALWEALAGERPFAGANTNEVFEQVLLGAIRNPPRGTIAPWVEAALRVGLAPLPATRHADMGELLARIADDPRRRRRRWLALGLAVAVVPLAAIGWQARIALAQRQCDREADVIDGNWTPQIAADMRTAFVATGASNGSSMADRASPRLDAYVEGWRTAASEVCMARDLEGALDEAAQERALACLSQQREALVTLVGALAEPDIATVEGAVFSVLQLQPSARCTDSQELALERRAPSDPVDREELRRIEAEVAGAETLRRLGRNREALDRLELQVEPAAALRWPAIIAMIDQRRAQLYQNVGEQKRCRELAEGSFLAAYAAGDERTAANSATLVSHHFVMTETDPAWAKHWDQLARAALSRIEGDATPQALFHAVAAGRRYMIIGELEEGEDEVERALALAERLYGPDHLYLAETLLVLSNLQSRRYAYPESRATSERAYSLISAAVGVDHPWTARALAGLGLAMHYDGDSEQGLALVDRALAIDQRLDDNHRGSLAADLSYAALILQESGYPIEAVQRLERALPIFRATYGDDHPEVELVLGNLGRAQQDAGDLAGARASFEQAIAMHDRAANSDEALRETSVRALYTVGQLEAERR